MGTREPAPVLAREKQRDTPVLLMAPQAPEDTCWDGEFASVALLFNICTSVL